MMKANLHRTLYTSATRLNNDQLINKTVSGNLPNLEEIAKDPYLHIRNYSNEDFAQSASYIATENQGVKRGKVIDELVNTLNHEYRHKHQHKQVREYFRHFLNLFISKENKIMMSQTECKQAQAFWRGQTFYTQPEKNYNKYYKNITERDARKAGHAAEKAYNDYSHKLAEAFHSEAFGRLFDCSDSSGLLRFLKKTKTINAGIFDLTRAANA